MIQKLLTALAAYTFILGLAVPASADHCDIRSEETCVHTTPGGWGVGGTKPGGGGEAPPSHGGNNGVPVALAPEYVQRRYVPACSGNAPEGGNDALCGAATTTCPVEGELRFWVFERTVTRATGAADAWQHIAPFSLCMGPEDPVLDPAVAIPALVQRDFQRVVVLKGVAEVSPKPDTLVNIPTVFTTSSPESYDIPLTLLGQSVVITAKAEKWTWHFDDGASASTTTDGSAGRVEHDYVKAGPKQAHVVIDWSGSFRINGGASQPITGSATTTGDPIDLNVKQARSELVAD